MERVKWDRKLLSLSKRVRRHAWREMINQHHEDQTSMKQNVDRF